MIESLLPTIYRFSFLWASLFISFLDAVFLPWRCGRAPSWIPWATCAWWPSWSRSRCWASCTFPWNACGHDCQCPWASSSCASACHSGHFGGAWTASSASWRSWACWLGRSPFWVNLKETKIRTNPSLIQYGVSNQNWCKIDYCKNCNKKPRRKLFNTLQLFKQFNINS